MSYDASGRLVERATYLDLTYLIERLSFHYDGDRLIAELDDTGVVREYLYAGGEAPSAMRARQGDGSYANYFFVTNTHGDVVAVTDRDGMIVNRYQYGPWGEATKLAEGVHQPFRYAGYRYEDGFDLYYLRARWYDAGKGRFLSRDDYRGIPKNMRTLNRYVYSECSPLTMVDPGGRKPRCSGDSSLPEGGGNHAFNVTTRWGHQALAAHIMFPAVPLEVILNTIYSEGGKKWAIRLGGLIKYKFKTDYYANVPPMMASRNMAVWSSMDPERLQDPSYNILVGTAFLNFRHQESGGTGTGDEHWTMVYANYVNEKRRPAEWGDSTGGLGEEMFGNFCARLQSFRSLIE